MCAAYARIVDEIIIDIRARITFETSHSVEQSYFWHYSPKCTSTSSKKACKIKCYKPEK